jgi:class III poly(R)-hydroxyalkanoic acid synthase PhaE subunit
MSERDAGEVYRALFERWRGLAPSEDWARTLERAFATQAAVGKTVELSLEAWRDLAATPPGAEWSAKLEQHAQRIQRQTAANVEAATKATGSPARWSDYLEYLSSLDLTGWNPFKNVAGTGPLAPGAGGSQLTGIVSDVYEATFGRAAGAPLFGPGRELNEKLLRAFEAWAEWIRAAAAYGEIVGETWRHAIERFLEELASHGEEQDAPSLRGLTTRFMEVAERVLVERFAQQDYVEAQARALEAGLRYRAAEQDLADLVLRHGHVPSRSEVDGAHRRVYELKQEVRALREEVRALREETRAARSAAESGAALAEEGEAR